MSITLTQNTTSINISYTEEPCAIEIFYKGKFTGYVNGNTIAGLNTERIIIAFLDKPSEELIYYYGSMDIKKLKAYNKNGDRIAITYKVNNDIIKNINTNFEDMTMKPEKFNRPKYFKDVKDPVIAFVSNGEERYMDSKAKLVTEENLKLNQKTMIRKVRRKNGIS